MICQSSPESVSTYWYKMYCSIQEENKKLKEQVHTLSRIDVIGQNGNEGSHYETLLTENEKLKEQLYRARTQNDLYKHVMES